MQAIQRNLRTRDTLGLIVLSLVERLSLFRRVPYQRKVPLYSKSPLPMHPHTQARAPGSPVVIVGTHMDRVKAEDRDRRKMDLSNIIKDKYLVSHTPLHSQTASDYKF